MRGDKLSFGVAEMNGCGPCDDSRSLSSYATHIMQRKHTEEEHRTESGIVRMQRIDIGDGLRRMKHPGRRRTGDSTTSGWTRFKLEGLRQQLLVPFVGASLVLMFLRAQNPRKPTTVPKKRRNDESISGTSPARAACPLRPGRRPRQASSRPRRVERAAAWAPRDSLRSCSAVGLGARARASGR